MVNKIRCKDFTMTEINYLIDMCNFSDVEKDIFLLRCKNIPIEDISSDLCLSKATVNRNIVRIKNKIHKVL